MQDSHGISSLKSSLRIEFVRQHRDIGELPIFVVVIQAVTDHEFIGDFEADEIDANVMHLSALFAQEHADLHRQGALIVQVMHEMFQGLPGVENIVEEQHMPATHVGEKIGPWPIFHLSEIELIAGRNNKHLDFRLSVLKEASGVSSAAVVSTICTTHNVFGKVYLVLVIPFHKWGVQRLMSQALAHGRL